MALWFHEYTRPCQGFIGRQRADHHRHLMALDQFLRFRLGLRGIAPGILSDQLDLSAGDHPISLIEEEPGALLLLLPAGGKRPGQNGEETDFQWLWCLCEELRSGIRAH